MMIEVDEGENQDFYLIVQIRFEFLLNVAMKIEETIEQLRRQYNFAFRFNYVKRLTVHISLFVQLIYCSNCGKRILAFIQCTDLHTLPAVMQTL